MSRNIVLMSWDSVRADHMTPYGYRRDTTPYLTASIARNGLLLDKTYVSGVGTPTSFTGVLTGEHAHGTQTNIAPEHWREANRERTMLQEILRDEGYYTGAFHANALMSRHYGWDRGWDVFEDHLWTDTGNGGGVADDGTVSDAAARGGAVAAGKDFAKRAAGRLGVASEAVHAKNIMTGEPGYARWEELWDGIHKFIENAPEPWFLWVLLVDMHHPWRAPSEHQQWKQPGARRMLAWNYAMRRWPKVTGWRRRSIINAYDNELKHADAFWGRLSSELFPSNTAVVFHSDHGDELGEHGSYGHRPAMWDTLTRVPAAVLNAEHSGTADGPHTLLDVPATVLGLADAPNDMPGTSWLNGGREAPIHVENRTEDGRAMRATVAADGRKLVETVSGDLYAFAPSDRFDAMPFEPNEQLTALHEAARRPDPENMEKKDNELSGATEKRLRELGYL